MSDAVPGTVLAIAPSANGALMRATPPSPPALANKAVGEIRRLEDLPSEIGVLLILLGIAGVVLPGPVGTPFVIAGGVVLWPGAFGRVERWFKKCAPGMHQHGTAQIVRYLADLEARYPGSTRRGS